MKKLFTLFFLCLVFSGFLVSTANAQLSGTYTIPGSYATIEDAIVALNANGVGSPGVTFNVSAGHTETVGTLGNYVINITTNPPDATKPVVFQKNGGGANPRISSASGGSGTIATASEGGWGDAFIKIVGNDFITFDGIDVADIYTGGVATQVVEYGYMILKASATDGCKNITIKNSTINLYKTNVYTLGIYVSNFNSAGTAVTVTSYSGRHERIYIDGNTVNGSYGGIYVRGFNHTSSPYDFYDTDIQIGTTAGNTIRNIGGGSAIMQGIYAIYADSIKIANNDIAGGTGTTTTSYGIFLSTGTNSFADVYSNTIQDTASSTTSSMYGISCSMGGSGTNNMVKIYNNTLKGFRRIGVTSGLLYFVYLSVGPYQTEIYGNNINNNTIGDATTTNTGTIAGIYTFTAPTTTSGSYLKIYNNNMKSFERIQSTLGSGSFYGVYTTSSAATYEVTGNTFKNLTIPSTSTKYIIYNSNSSPTNVNLSGNTFDSIYVPNLGYGTLYAIYNLSSAASSTHNLNNNIINNIRGASNITSTSSVLYGIYTSNATTSTVNSYGNSVDSIIGVSRGTIYGLYYATANYINVYNNTVTNLINEGVGNSGQMMGIYLTGGSTAVTNCYQNTIANLYLSRWSIFALYNATGLTTNIYRNNLYGFKAPQLGSGGDSCVVYGLCVGSSTTSAVTNVYNNYISDISWAGTRYLGAGIYMFGSTTGTTYNIFYNTVYMDRAVSTSSAALYANTTPTCDLRNNILINKSTGSTAIAHWRSSATLATYSSNSNNNVFYAGTPGPSNLIYSDGTNTDQTLSAYKTRVTPMDAGSVSENPPFENVASTPYDLRIKTTVATQVESGGQRITSPIAITDDYQGDVRWGETGYTGTGTAPDIGADEFNGIKADLTPPDIIYTPLPNTPLTTDVTLSGVTITDLSGVDFSTYKPRMYFKKSTDANTFIDNTNSTDGWKYVETTSGSSPADFTTDYTLLQTAPTTGDVIQYFIVAQDLAAVPNVAINSGTPAKTPSSVDLTSDDFPLTGTIRSYTISNAPLSGSYTVGIADFNRITGKNITFEKVVKKVMKEIVVEEPKIESDKFEKGTTPVGYEEQSTKLQPEGRKELVEVEEISWVPTENGVQYRGPLYAKKSELPNLNYDNGTEGVYATITAAAADLSLRGVSSAVTFLLTDASYTTGETYPIVLEVNNVNKPTSVNTVTIKPNTSVTTIIQGASPNGEIFRIYNTGYIIIDGSNNGTTSRDMTIENTSATGPQVVRIASTGTTPVNGAVVKNCNIINGAVTSSAVVLTDIGGGAGYFKNITIQNNVIRKAYIGLYALAGTATGNGRMNINNNILMATSTDSIRLVGLYAQGCDSVNVFNNYISQINGGRAEIQRGIWFATGTRNSSIYNNTVDTINCTNTGAFAPTGIWVTSAISNANVKVYGNTTSRLTAAGTGTTAGIGVSGATQGVEIYKNKIFTIKNTNSGGYPCAGIYLASTLTNANVTTYNNVMYDIYGYGYSLYTTDNGYGIWVYSGGGYNIYFNSVNLATNQSSSTGLPACININSTITTAGCLDIRDNIFTTTQTVGTNRFSIICNAANTVFSNIDFNDYYSTNAVGYIGSAVKTTIADWRTGSGQDLNSKADNPMFASANDLRPDGSSSVINAGTPISGIGFDFLDSARNPTNPTMGAYEKGVDLTGPIIQYTTLQNTISTANRYLTNVTITDFTGVDVTANKPRIYYKKSTDNNVFGGNTSGDNGWKWTQTSETSSPFTFTIDYSIINGGSVNVGDIVQYFVVAQDVVTPTPFVSANPSAGFAGTSVSNITSAPTTPNSYGIYGSISGNLTVGTGGTYPSLTGAGGLFADLNSKVVTGNIVVDVLSDLTETGANALNQFSEEPANSNYTLAIRPSSASMKTISGSYAGGLIRLNGADRVTFEGNFSGSGRYLTFSNTSTSGSSVFQLISLGSGLGAKLNQIRNTIIQAGAGGTSGIYGICIGGSTLASTGADNDSNTVYGNIIKKAYVGLWAQGTATTNPGAMDYLLVQNNTFGSDVTSEYLGHDGIIVGNTSGSNISQNNIYNIVTSATTPVGLTLSTGVINSQVSRNRIDSIRYTGTVGYGGRGMYISTGNATSNVTIDNNVISRIWGDGYTSFSNSSMVGMYFDGTCGGFNVYYNSIYLSGGYSRSAAATKTACILFFTNTVNNFDIRNNAFYNSMNNIQSQSDSNFAIYSNTPASAFNSIDYNDYYVSDSAGYLGMLNGLVTNLAGWKSATGKDVNSISADPNFNSTYLLQPKSVSPLLNAGVPISGFGYDYLGTSRSGNTSIGAYEFGNDAAPPVIAYTALGNTTSTANRTLSSVSITDDDSGVDVTTNKPRIYYKKNWQDNAFGANNSTFNGWKWKEFTPATTFDFDIDYSLLFPSGTVSGGDVIQYFVVAQDLNGTPNVGAFPNAGFTATSVSNITSAPTNPSTYQVNSASPLSGTYTIGLGAFNALTGKNLYYEKRTREVEKTFQKMVPVERDAKDVNNAEKDLTEVRTDEKPPVDMQIIYETKIVKEDYYVLMENDEPYNGPMFAPNNNQSKDGFTEVGSYITLTSAIGDLNFAGMSGPVVFSLIDNSYLNETLPITINSVSGMSYENNLTIKPASGKTPVISGSSTTAVLKINGADYVTIDGSNSGGTDRSLSFINNNASGTSAVVWIGSLGTGAGAKCVTIKNCNIKNGYNTSGAYGIFAGSATTIGTAADDNDSLTILNNNVQKAYVGIYAYATATGVNDVLNINNNSVGSNTLADYIQHDGIMVSYAVVGSISGNNIFNLVTSATTPVGLTVQTGVTDFKVSKNIIDSVRYTGTGGWGGRGIYTNSSTTPNNNQFDNNVITRIGGDGYSSFSNSSPVGLYFDGVGGGFSVLYNSVYMSGQVTYNTATLTTAIYFGNLSQTLIDCRNNVFMNTINNPNNAGAKNYAIHSLAPASSFTYLDNNDYFVTGTQGVLGYFNSADRTTLAAWKTETTKDVSSISGDPAFTSNINLQPDVSNVNCWNIYGKGVALSTINYDVLNASRNTNVNQGPTCMGAYEFTPTVSAPPATASGPPAPSTTTNYTQNSRPIMDITWGASDNFNKKDIEQPNRNNKSKSNLRSGGNKEMSPMSLPTVVEPKYISGVLPPDLPATTHRRGYGIWYIDLDNDPNNPVTVTIYYGMEQLGNVATENDLILCKYDSTTRVWVPFYQGVGEGYSVLNTTAKTISVSGITELDRSVWALTDNGAAISRLQLGLTAVVAGYFDSGTGFMRTSDRVKITLRNVASPYAVVSSDSATMSTSGAITFLSEGSLPGTNYFIVFNHRNSVETWSAAGQSFSRVTGRQTYNFTTGVSQAYGDNLKNIDGVYCIYNGDINQDGAVLTDDYDLWFNDFIAGLTGTMIASDLNGDGAVLTDDYDLWFNNFIAGVSKQVPPGLMNVRTYTKQERIQMLREALRRNTEKINNNQSE